MGAAAALQERYDSGLPTITEAVSSARKNMKSQAAVGMKGR
jgi:hypothetical protein